MTEFGGYFELELNKTQEYHAQALKLNSGRNCLLYILKAQKPSKIYIPSYICNSVLAPIISEGIKFDFYNINEKFEIISNLSLNNNEKLFYVNYYGLKSDYVNYLCDTYSCALIIDNTQAFFELPLAGIDTIYSPRKFFGVSDGGYLYTEKTLDIVFEKDESTEFAMHLLGRRDIGASHYYKQYQKSEDRLSNQPIKEMSRLTQEILQSIDYETAKSKREINFKNLHLELRNKNIFNLDEAGLNGPMTYPFFTKDKMLREYLIGKNVYVARYWDDVLDRDSDCDTEKRIVEQLVPLPIDQRYCEEDMQKILKFLVKTHG